MRTKLEAGWFSYIESGDAGEVVLLLHALGRSAADWQPVIDRLGAAYRVLALDMRGHGDSCRPGVYSFEVMRDDVLEFVDALGLDRFHLIGHSMGATTSILFAERWPDRLDRLVLEDTPPPSGRESIPPPPDQPDEPVAFDWPLIGSIVDQLNHPDPSWWTDLDRITAPTLIIAGGKDSFIDQAELAETARLIPNADLVTIEAGHHIHTGKPDEFTSAVMTFLTE